MPTYPVYSQATVQASLSDLMRKGCARSGTLFASNYKKAFGQAALDVRLEIEWKFPNDYGKDPIALMQLVEARRQFRSVLQNYGRRMQRRMLWPTKGWSNPPVVHTGVPGHSQGYGMLDTDTGDMATGAYVQATEKSSPNPEQEGQNEAAWHYIWTNNGVHIEDGINVQTRPSRSGKHKGAPSLKFNMPYTAATLAGTFKGGTHSSGPIEVYTDHVKRNVLARNWVGKAVEELQPQYNAAILAALIRGVAKYNPQLADSHIWKMRK